MTPSDKAPLVGWMILEDYCEDMSQWDGVIAFPDPTGANLAWEDPIKMIEHSAYDALAKRCADVTLERDKLAELLQWADRLAKSLQSVKDMADGYSKIGLGFLAHTRIGDEVRSALAEFQQWREGK